METVLKPCVGTTMKINVTANLGNDLHLGDESVDFECVFYVGDEKRNSQLVKKGEMVKVDDDNYIAIVKTSIVGKGEIMWAYMGIANQTLIDQNLMSIEWGTNSAAGWIVNRDAKMVSVNADRSIGNGTAGAAANNDSWGAQIDGKYKIGGRNTDYLYSGKVYAIRIYSRKLSASEMIQNQRLDNNRFGLNESM